MKSISTILAVLSITAILPIQALAATFSDVSLSNENSIAIEYLVSSGTLQGYPDGTFKPDQTINRAELMKILVAGQGIDPNADQYKNCFPDVTTEWFARFVCYAKEKNWVSGYPDGSFRPAQTVQKSEAAKMIVGAYGLKSTAEELSLADAINFTDVSTSDWFHEYILPLTNVTLLDSFEALYFPANSMTRGLTAEYIFRVLVAQDSDAAFTERNRADFLANAGLSDLAKGEAYIKNVFYDGKVYQVESDEYVEISNRGNATMNLEGYTLKGSSGDEVYTFPDLDLAPNESVKIYTNEGTYNFGSEDAVWSNSGETVSLYDSSGDLVDEYQY